jgi:uncharacterized membrane protein YfcA
MSLALYIALACCLALVSFAISMLGLGGGVFFTPIQMFFGIEIHSAASVSLFLTIILSASATSVYRRAGKVDWGMAVLLATSAMVGAFAGGYLSNYLSQKMLTALLIMIIVIAGASMLRRKHDRKSPAAKRNVWYQWHRQACGERYSVNLFLALPLLFIAGVLGAMVGIAGGAINMPMMVLLLDIPVDIAIATSSFMVGIIGASGFAGHAVAGNWDWKLSMILAPGVLLCAQLGAHTMLRMDREMLKRVFGVLMFIIAAGLVVRYYF